MDRKMQIYLTNREDYYQNGILMGKWIKLPIPEEMLEGIFPLYTICDLPAAIIPGSS